MTTSPTPKRGLRFLHARQITRTSTGANPVPEECVVTAVRNGMVYFVNSSGYRSFVPRTRFAAVVKEVVG